MNRYMTLNKRLHEEEDDTPSGGGGGIGIEGSPPPVNSSPSDTPPNPPKSEAKDITLDFDSEDTYQKFLASLPEETRERGLFKTTKSLKALADQALNAESALGKRRLAAPQEDWKDEQWTEFLDQIRPEAADKYSSVDKLEVSLEGMEEPKEFEFDEDTTTLLKNVAHELGLPDRAFSTLQKKWAEHMVASELQVESAVKEAINEHVNKLREEWGPDYAVKHRAANEAYEAISQLVPELNELMEWSPFVANHPGVMKLFEALSPVVAELGAPQGGSQSGFGSDSVASIKAELDDIMSQHRDLIYLSENQMATLSGADRARRDKILERRATLFKKLYGTE